MISACHGRVFCPHVHLQMLEEVVVLARSERDQHSDGARQRRVHQGVVASRNKTRFLEINENVRFC
jgi:hypothetical protein